MRYLFTLLMLGLLSACQTTEPASMLDLAHRNFVLVAVNQQPLNPSPKQMMNLSFGEHLFVEAKICRQFQGFAHLTANQLQVDELAISSAACTDPLAKQADQLLEKMLKQGVQLIWQGQTLSLQQGEQQLSYQLRDYVL